MSWSASTTSFEEHLDCFFDAIPKKSSPPLLVVPTRPAVQPFEAPKRSSSRLVNNKLAKIPISFFKTCITCFSSRRRESLAQDDEN
jgi:hypothetical protein